jgi:hypothetical protein
MAESGRNCAECGRALKLFSGLTMNGDAYHDFCWEMRRLGRSEDPARGQTKSAAPAHGLKHPEVRLKPRS